MKKILFIEDESALQKTFGEILAIEGYEMVSALDGETGLKLAQTEKPDLIILDLVLPKLHGFEVLRKVKADKEIKDIPVIVLTNANYSLEEVINKVKKALEE
jgi:DNA-binding response OmpR family regulator